MAKTTEQSPPQFETTTSTAISAVSKIEPDRRTRLLGYFLLYRVYGTSVCSRKVRLWPFVIFCNGRLSTTVCRVYTYWYLQLFLLLMSFSLAVEALHAFTQDEPEHKKVEDMNYHFCPVLVDSLPLLMNQKLTLVKRISAASFTNFWEYISARWNEGRLRRSAKKRAQVLESKGEA
ncbi:hypothetical protein CASFOL_033456 [Castilleja foliolosa]|uniref:Uncharacterized protein n=1 Tax=Castilleja foliolosa TaxID=1961234 RepID=A0ABD3C067_9LAMI